MHCSVYASREHRRRAGSRPQSPRACSDAGAVARQVNSALALGVSISRDASVRAAGGYMVQVLPFASEGTLARLEANVAAAQSVTDMLHAGAAPADIAARLLDGLGMTPGFSLVPRRALRSLNAG